MKEGLLDDIKATLPNNFRIKLVFGDLEGPGEMIWRICPPNYYFIQRATKRGVLGLFRGWQTVGEVDCEEDAVYIHDPYYDELAGPFRTAFAVRAPLIAVMQGIAGSTLRYFDRLAAEPSLLAGFRRGRETLRFSEPEPEEE